MRSRKSQGDVELPRMIVILALAIILILFTRKALSNMNEENQRTACSLSILKASQKIGSDYIGYKLGGIDCPVFDTEIKFDDVKMKQGIGNNWVINDSAVKDIITTEMYKCWKMVHKGQKDPFHEWNGNPAYCLICNNVVFDDEFIEEANKTHYELRNLWSYMASRNIPDGKGSIFKYIIGAEATPEILKKLDGGPNEFPYDYKVPWSIGWRMQQDGHSWTGVLVAIGIGAGIAIAASVCIATAPICAPAAAGASAGSLYGVATFLAGSGIYSAGTRIAIAGASYAIGERDTGPVDSDLMFVPTPMLGSKFDKNVYPQFEGKYFCDIIVN